MADDIDMEHIASSNLVTNASQEDEAEPKDSHNIFSMDFIPLGEGESTGDSSGEGGSHTRSSDMQAIERKPDVKEENNEVQTVVKEEIKDHKEELSKQIEVKVEKSVSGVDVEPPRPLEELQKIVKEEVKGQEEVSSQNQIQGEKSAPEVDIEAPGPSGEQENDEDEHNDDEHDDDEDEHDDEHENDEQDDDQDDEAGGGGDDDTEGGDSKSKEEIIDPYSYTKRDEFTSEIFKIEIGNLPRKYGFKQFKKMITACLNIKPVKIKSIPRATHAFVTFRNEEERMKALAALRGKKWKGRKLVTKLAKALPDPVAAQRAEGLARKRFIEEAAQSNEDAKRTKLAPSTEEEKQSVLERLNHSVTPLWDQSYPTQIQIKARSMVDTLKRLTKQLRNIMELKGSWVEKESNARGGLCCELLSCIESPIVDGYRNKCEFTIADGPDGAKTVGFRVGSYREGYSGVVEPSKCIHISEIAKKVAAVFQNYIRKSSLDIYDLCFHTGHWQTLTVRSTQYGESMVVVQFNPQLLPKEVVDKEVNDIKEFFTVGEGKDCNLTSIYVQVNRTRAVGGNAEAPLTLLHGQPCIHEVICDVKFRISPNAFFQVNTKAAEMMFYKMREWMEDCGTATLLDICCGTGSIGLSLAKYVAKVIGVELIESAVEDARKNAETNEITNAKFVCGKAEDVIVDQVFRKLPRKLPVIGIVDPPRAGLHSTVIQAIRKCQKMDTLIYVSCNPNSAFSNLLDLCRPTSKRIRTWPFRLVKAVPVDLFPHTKHCELVMLFKRDSTSVDAAKFYKFFY